MKAPAINALIDHSLACVKCGDCERMDALERDAKLELSAILQMIEDLKDRLANFE